jgi:hypothetical protein
MRAVFPQNSAHTGLFLASRGSLGVVFIIWSLTASAFFLDSSAIFWLGFSSFFGVRFDS